MKPRHLPAEWHKQDAILLTWPHADTDWSERLEDVEAVYLDIVGALSHSQDVLIQVHDSIDTERLAVQFEREGINQARCHLIQANSDDTWARDHGAITVFEDEEPLLLDFTFNGWGNKFDANRDNALNQSMADSSVFKAPLQRIDWVLEGGSIESDGQGTLMTTRACLLNTNRNGSHSQTSVEAKLKEWFGVTQVLWLNHGELAGDDTDAHIDTLARFAPGNTLVYQGCSKPDDDHYSALQSMAAELDTFRNVEGKPYKLLELPWPDAQYSEDGRRLPATYANFLVTNQTVLLPIYGTSQDGQAIEVLSEAFPEHRIIPIDCRALIEQGGSLHCITMQLPSGVLSERMLDQVG